MLLGGRYELLRSIASGGMATVHLARAIGVGGFERLVAVKVMHPHIAAEAEFVAMFLDEARLAAQIRHPNVVATIDVQEGADSLFLVMEYVDGPSLKHLRRRADDWRLPIGILLRVLIDALNGLHAAHELRGEDDQLLQMIHRDVSPANILVGVDGVTRITDFGVARAETRLSSTRGGQLKGKIPYMPPEQLMSEPMDRRADVYATGVVLWEELTGRRLFKAASEGALLRRILDGPEKSPNQVDERIPAALDRVCMRALSNDPDRRHATAAQLAEALEAAAAESDIPVASTREVADFVQTSGVYEKLDQKKLAALKRASRPGPDFSAEASRGEHSDRAAMSSPSPVTAAATTVSTSAFMAQRASSRGAILIGSTVAVVGLLGGYWIATSSNAPTPVIPTTTAVSSTPPAAPAVDPKPSATLAAPSASMAAARASTSVRPPAPWKRPVPDKPAASAKTSPRPPSGSYNPERL